MQALGGKGFNFGISPSGRIRRMRHMPRMGALYMLYYVLALMADGTVSERFYTEYLVN